MVEPLLQVAQGRGPMLTHLVQYGLHLGAGLPGTHIGSGHGGEELGAGHGFPAQIHGSHHEL